jgi:L-lactate dehydrogenase (cytochrome)
MPDYRRNRVPGGVYHQGERAVAAAAAKYGTMFGVSSLGTVSLDELRKAHDTSQIYQFYFHKDRGLNRGNAAAREGRTHRHYDADRRQHYGWEPRTRSSHRLFHTVQADARWDAAICNEAEVGNQLHHSRAVQIAATRGAHRYARQRTLGRGYFTEMLDPSMNWDDVAEMVRHWNGQFCLKGVMSPADAKHAAEIGCTGIVVSNHGGRQLDGSRASFDQLAEIVDAVGDRIDVFMDGGVQRGTHVLKALSVGAKAVGVGRYYLYPLAAAGELSPNFGDGLKDQAAAWG